MSCTVKPTPAVTAASSSSFQRPERPERAPVAHLQVVVEEADQAAAERGEEHGQAGKRVDGEREEREQRGDEDQQAAHRRRPLLDDVARPGLPPGSADRPARARSASMNLGPITTAITIAIRPAIRTRTMPGRCSRSAAGTPSSPTAREAFTSTASPGRSSSSNPSGRSTQRISAHAGRQVCARRLADGDQRLHAELREQRADLAVVALRLVRPARPSRRGCATRRRPPARSVRSSRAARIEAGLAL